MKKLLSLIFAVFILATMLSSCFLDELLTEETTVLSDYTSETTDDTTVEESSANVLTSAEIIVSSVTLNKGTDAELTRTIYKIPAGTYLVKNIDSKYMDQINVYSYETRITDEGYEEQADGFSKLIDAGKSEVITIPENYYVYISNPANLNRFEFIKQDVSE